ncbi:hypothetical protein FXO38_17877 [Capsicum annuum]|nr:hypothetical protein FXO38_17877 [Capsicum annuum]KAF3651689.1 hypothetical protein FXO37_17902 [Capsicum annuum]
MAEDTRWKLNDEKIARHDEMLADLLNLQQEVKNTQVGIQGTLELILDRLGALERDQQARTLAVDCCLIQLRIYFMQYRIIDENKVETAALYLNGSAEVWYHSLVLSRGVVNWVDFKEELISRFGEILVEDVVEEFNKLSQTGTIDEFLGRFEDLKAQMLIRNPALNEAHFLSSFIGALKEEIRFAIKMFKPTTLKGAIEKARMQEMAIEAALRRNKSAIKSNQTLVNAGGSANKILNNPAIRTNTFRISPEVYDYRKTNHLCFKCGDKYGLRHICKKKQLNCLVGEVEVEPILNEEEPVLGAVEIPEKLT